VDAGPERAVDDQDCQVPFEFGGQINKLTLTIDRQRRTPADAQRNNKTSE
jgi:hypothetical protein